MWALGVVVGPPCFGAPTCRGQAAEQVFVQAFIPDPAIKAFHESVLLRFAGCDGVPQHPPLLLPAQDRVRRPLRAVAADDRRQLAATLLDGAIKFAADPQARP